MRTPVFDSQSVLQEFMPNDKPSYKQARKQDWNRSRVVVEGVDEPVKPFASNMPKDQTTSPDLEDQRHANEKPLPRLGKL